MSPTVIQWQELARTTGAGAEAILLWNDSRKQVRVAVIEQRLCHHLDFEINGARTPGGLHPPFLAAAARLTGANGHSTAREGA